MNAHLLDYEYRYTRSELAVPGPDGDTLRVTSTGYQRLWLVRDTGTVRLELMEALFNWRLTIGFTSTPHSLEGAWCYFGRDWHTFRRAVTAAHTFDPATQDAPNGYDKQVLDWDHTLATVPWKC
ncbi:hypothetical protein [Nocardiopsis synnemataformans]|uniref:hypothetical protein n=1 Tax=Nocardiopsis synnemataformans TaxID=61305 RepID=UPI003EBA1546